MRKLSIQSSILLILLLVGMVAAAGYIRLYFLIAEHQIKIPYLSSSLATVQRGTPVDKKVFGSSTKGRPIEGYEIGRGENGILLFSSIHGDEVGTTDLLNQLVDEIKANPRLVASGNKLIVIPIVNPDGYYDRTDKLNANGVNLNLNFATSDWGRYGPEGTYGGPEPFSELESQVLKRVVEQYSPAIMIAYHSSGALVTPEENEASRPFGKWYANKTGYTYYDSTNFDWDYPGTATKWFMETTDQVALTVELSKDTESDWEINKNVLFELISSEKSPILPESSS